MGRVIFFRRGKIGDHALLATQLVNSRIFDIDLLVAFQSPDLSVYESVGINVKLINLSELRLKDTILVFPHPKFGIFISSFISLLSLLFTVKVSKGSAEQYQLGRSTVDEYVRLVPKANVSEIVSNNNASNVTVEKLVIIAPNGSEPAKDLSVASVIDLVNRLETKLRLSRPNISIKILPSYEKISEYQSIAAIKNDQLILASSPASMMEKLQTASLIIGVDSSSIALANLYRIPFVCFQGMRIPTKIWQANQSNHLGFNSGYYLADETVNCRHCYLKECSLGNICINSNELLTKAIEISEEILYQSGH